MLDWFSGYVGYDASNMRLGRFYLQDPSGEILRDSDSWETARGSFESGVQVTRGNPTVEMLAASRKHGFLCADQAVLRVSGNPSKFLQGHNVAGPSVSQLGPMVQAMVRLFGEGLRPVNADDERLPAVHRSRVDVTTAVDLGSHESVHDWLRLAEAATRSRHGRAIGSKGTVYWGKNSRRWTIKAYCKHCELLAHPPAISRDMLAVLLEWSRTQLRIELTLRRPELQARGTLNESVIWEYLARLEIPNMRANVGKMADFELTPAVKGVFLLWMEGHDVAGIYPRATFYRHRRAILDQVGVDISMTPRAQVEADPETLLGVEELQRREVVKVPDRIQRSLFGVM